MTTQLQALGRLRYALEEARTLHRSSLVHQELVMKNRERVVKLIVEPLYQRWRKANTNRPFAEWLDGRRLEDTYLHNAYRTRRRWATWQVEQLTNRDLMLDNPTWYDPAWYFDAISEAIQLKAWNVARTRNQSADFMINIETIVLDPIVSIHPKERMTKATTITFLVRY